MKHLFACLGIVLIVSGAVVAQSPHSQFNIIGYGAWRPIYGGNDTIPDNVWETIHNAGYNGVTMFVQDIDVQSNLRMFQRAREEGMLSYPSYMWHDSVGYSYITRGFRWRYQLEYSAHFGGQNRAGVAYLDPHHLTSDEILAAVKDADAFNDDFNSWSADATIHSSGLIGLATIGGTVQNTSDTLHVRVRLRLPDAPSVDSNLAVLYVRVLAGQTPLLIDTIRTHSLKRLPWLPLQSDGVSLRLNQDYGEVYCGFFLKPDSAAQAYSIELTWPGNVTTIIDYVAIDDAYADELFSGRIWDHAFDTELARFGLCISY